MSYGKIVTFSMLLAFSVGAGYSVLAEKQSLQLARTSWEAPSPIDKTKIVSHSFQTTEIAPKTKTAVNFHPYTLCSGSVRIHCVVDGDTLWHEGTKIRVADIDAPEVGEPKCSSEAALGARATKRLLQLVNERPFELAAWGDRDVDKYGRKLRILVRDGESLGDILVSENLARRWTGRRQPWC